MRKLIVLAIVLLSLFSVSLSFADDLEIYGGAAQQVDPNVLLIFDTSGSMTTRDVPGDVFDSTANYAGSQANDTIYLKSGDNYSYFAPSISSITCARVVNDLNDKGWSRSRFRTTSPYACRNRGARRTVTTGRYANFLESGANTSLQRRTDVAKRVATEIVTTTDNVRFGLMRFNGSNGGTLLQSCTDMTTTSRSSLLGKIATLPASGYTPLAETLAEAGLYFAGQYSWYHSSLLYTSPIEERCQKNYAIVLTDGVPVGDRDSRLHNTIYMNGSRIGDYDGDNASGEGTSNTSTYLDDVAAFLYNEDLSSLGSVDDFKDQVVNTYTIGFKTSQTLLEHTAQVGGGEYYTANAYADLLLAFESIIANVGEHNAVFVAPVVPVNRLNRTYAGNKVYLGFFRPEQEAIWSGNIKSYNFSSAGEITDALGAAVLDSDGMILSGSQSLWSSVADGSDVKLGGVGEQLNLQTSRNIYTYLGTSTSLTDSSNEVDSLNTVLTMSHLDVLTEAERLAVISSVHGDDRAWKLGSIVHSEPLIVHYDGGTPKSYIFVGANDGMLHVFDDDTGEEAWAFVPPDQLDGLKSLLLPTHTYSVDGSPVVYDDGTVKYLIFGLRRGGSTYSVLDITSPLSPVWKYSIDATHLVAPSAVLGLSWSKPQVHKIVISGAHVPVWLFSGGYDVNQDSDSPAATDFSGKAVFATRISDGSLTSLNFNASNTTDMQNSIIGLFGAETAPFSLLNLVYATDLGGRLFGIHDSLVDGTWEIQTLFKIPTGSVTSSDGTVFTPGRVLMYPPEAVQNVGSQTVYFGSGNRERPTDTSATDAFYAITNTWEVDSDDNKVTYSMNDLYDVTQNLIQDGDTDQVNQAEIDLAGAKGWYLRFDGTGEKIVSSPVVFNKVIYFTTYTPSGVTTTSTDPCTVDTARGIAKLYAIDYQTGQAVFHLDGQNAGNNLTKADRSVEIGTALPSPPVVVITQEGAKLLVGIEGGILSQDVDFLSTIKIFYWQQL